uniref:Peptidyl-tRNA hydrolase 2, mitochondrial n=1 Tax=Phallusia mammillata TaxID=59560 RepID=A0A6F9DQN9_9ASCI|nr:peptidyl-tRNA hydrolase 2, mitochondrial-like [Phallusia mammillata]
MMDQIKYLDAKYIWGFLTSVTCGIVVGWILKGIASKKSYLPTLQQKSSNTNLEGDFDDEDFNEKNQFKMVIAVRQDLKMGKGKVAAQCSHAAVGAYKKLNAKNKSLLKCWEYNGQPKVVVKCQDENQLLELFHHARAIGLIATVIEDAGRTQISPGSKTVLGVGPGPEDDVNKVTGHLKLL